jgi:ankyrin repeat protein
MARAKCVLLICAHYTIGCSVDVDSTCPPPSQTALHKAALHAHIPVLSYLLADRRMSPFGPDREGFTALHGACSRGHVEVVNILLERGAGGYDPEEELGDSRQRGLDRQAKAGWTPLSQSRWGTAHCNSSHG